MRRTYGVSWNLSRSRRRPEFSLDGERPGPAGAELGRPARPLRNLRALRGGLRRRADRTSE
eukprot:2532640-Alexandrium_andersonii.AAC.1